MKVRKPKIWDFTNLFLTFISEQPVHIFQTFFLFLLFCNQSMYPKIIICFMGIVRDIVEKLKFLFFFVFFILNYVFWKRLCGYHSNNRINSHMLLDSDFLCFPKIYTLCGLLLFFYKIWIHEQEVVKKVKVFKKLTRHIETLQADVVMIFLESSFWNNR